MGNSTFDLFKNGTCSNKFIDLSVAKADNAWHISHKMFVFSSENVGEDEAHYSLTCDIKLCELGTDDEAICIAADKNCGFVEKKPVEEVKQKAGFQCYLDSDMSEWYAVKVVDADADFPFLHCKTLDFDFCTTHGLEEECLASLEDEWYGDMLCEVVGYATDYYSTWSEASGYGCDYMDEAMRADNWFA